MTRRTRAVLSFLARDKSLCLGRRTALMGVVNVTPDSFSDGGAYLDPGRALKRCLQLYEEGADILDLGGESSRPGSLVVPADVELSRVIPVLRGLRPEVRIMLSVDTTKPEVARVALEEGADIINDISGFRNPEMPEIVARYGAGAVLMHMRGEPVTMQELPPSPDILKEMVSDLKTAVERAYSHGIERDRIVVDPGIGFGKTVIDNLRILNQLAALEVFGLPVLVGTSRKSFLGRILGSNDDRLWGTAASVAVSIVRGAHIVRVHDVKSMRIISDVSDAILSESLNE